MESIKLKVRVGPHEFEAEGPQEIVDRQFEKFSELIGTVKVEASGVKQQGRMPDQQPTVRTTDTDQILKIAEKGAGNVISLSALPPGDNRERDSVLLILLAHKLVDDRDLVPADDLLNGLKQSGFGSLSRADRLTGTLERDGFLAKSGVRRGVRYRLTNPGLARARELANQLASTVA